MRVDLLTLYAFSDKAHAKQRELWRGFLALVLPLLMEYDASEFERVLENSQCRSIEQILSSLESPNSVNEVIWFISGSFSEALGFEPELGVAAFLDVELPTRVHAGGRGSSAAKEEAMISLWLKAFRSIQQRPEFLEMTTEWKRLFELQLEDENVSKIDTEESEPEVSSSEAVSLERKTKKTKKSA